MRIQTELSDKLKKHSSHHASIPDWMNDCVEWENNDILIEKVEQKISSVWSKKKDVAATAFGWDAKIY